MNKKQVVVLCIALIVAFGMFEYPPVMQDPGSMGNQITDVRKLEDYLAIDTLITVILMVMLFDTTSAYQRDRSKTLPTSQGDSPSARGMFAVPVHATEPDRLRDREGRKRSTAILIPVFLIVLLVLAGCYLFWDSLQANNPHANAIGRDGTLRSVTLLPGARPFV